MNATAAFIAFGSFTIGMLAAAFAFAPVRYFKKGYEVACRDLMGIDNYMIKKYKKLNRNLRQIRYLIAEAAASSDKHFVEISYLTMLEIEALKQEGYIVKPRLDESYVITWWFENADDFYFNNTKAKKEWREEVVDELIPFCPCCGQRLR